MNNDVQIYLDHLEQYWDRQTYSLIPNYITNDPVFIKAVNYLKLKYGALYSPYIDNGFYISHDIFGVRSQFRRADSLDLNKELDAYLLFGSDDDL